MAELGPENPPGDPLRTDFYATARNLKDGLAVIFYSDFSKQATSLFLMTKLKELPYYHNYPTDLLPYVIEHSCLYPRAQQLRDKLKDRIYKGRVCLVITRGGMTGPPIFVMNIWDYRYLCGLGAHLVKVANLYSGLPLNRGLQEGKFVALHSLDYQVSNIT